jgi:hypothetical protein
VGITAQKVFPREPFMGGVSNRVDLPGIHRPSADGYTIADGHGRFSATTLHENRVDARANLKPRLNGRDRHRGRQAVVD